MRNAAAGIVAFVLSCGFIHANEPRLAVLAISQRVFEGQGELPPNYRTWTIPDPKYQERLAKIGFTHYSTVFCRELTWDLLKQFNVVVLIGMPIRERVPGYAKCLDEQMELLRRFIAEGGGLLVLHSPDWSFGLNIKAMNEFLDPYGAEVLFEQVLDSDESHRYRRFGLRSALHWTGQIADHPATRGVRGILFPDYHNDWHSFTQPVRVGEEWSVLVRGEKTSRSVRSLKAGTVGNSREEPGTYSASPPILAVRQAGKGRLALWPTASTCIWQDGYHAKWGNGLIMEGGTESLPSDGAKLLDQLLLWLAEPSCERGDLGGYVAKPPSEKADEPGLRRIDWDKARPEAKSVPDAYVGLAGAQSSLSVGTGTPQEFIAAAKKAGYQWIAFAEDFAKLDKAKLEALKAACKATSDDAFQAFPGFTYLDEAGCAHLVFGDNIYWPRDDWISKKFPGRITTNNVLFRGYQFLPLAVIKAGQNPKKAWFLGNFKGFGVYTYEDGKLADDSFDTFLQLEQDRFDLFPLSVRFVHSPDAVAAERRNGYQTYLRWFELKTCLDAIRGHGTAVWQGKNLWAHPCFISSGPIIEDFAVVNFGTSDLAIPENDRHRIHILVTSPVGLAEVKVYDGEKVFRRFRVEGNVFEHTFDNFHDRQYNYVIVVTDRNGGRAVSWCRGTSVQEYFFTRCSDNFNTMSFGKWYNSRVKPLRGIEDYIHQTSLSFFPVLACEGKDGEKVRPEDTRRYAVQQRIVQSGRFGSVVDHVLRYCYCAGADGNWNKAVIEPTEPLETLEGNVRVTRFTPRPDQPILHLIEGDIQIKKDMKLVEPSSLPFVAAVMHGLGGLNNFCIMAADGSVTRKRLEIDSKGRGWSEKGVLGVNRYAGFYPALGGSIGAIPLSQPLRYFARFSQDKDGTTGGYLAVGMFEEGDVLKAGQEIRYRLLTVHSERDPEPNDEFLSSVHDALGFDGAPAYAVTCTRGKVLDTVFALHLRAEDGGVCARIAAAKLPIDLPTYVEGLNPRWHAGIWYKGEQMLVIPEWTLDATLERYAVRRPRKVRDELVRFPVSEEGIGMLQIDTEVGDKEVYIGNLLVCDQPDVWLSLTDVRPGKRKFVAHNPTNGEIRCTVRPAPGLDLLSDFAKTLTIAPGASAEVEIDKTP